MQDITVDTFEKYKLPHQWQYNWEVPLESGLWILYIYGKE